MTSSNHVQNAKVELLTFSRSKVACIGYGDDASVFERYTSHLVPEFLDLILSVFDATLQGAFRVMVFILHVMQLLSHTHTRAQLNTNLYSV